MEEGDHLIDGNILDASNIVLVAEDEKVNHEILVAPGAKRRIVRTDAVATNFVVGDPTDEPLRN